MLLEAFARHCEPDDTLVIAGDGPERDKLIAHADTLGTKDQVRFIGHVENVHALYSEADVFVLSSHYEGVPAVIIEALAAGLPIAATDCCASMAWLAGNGRFGAVSPPGDVPGFGAAMNRARHLKPDQTAMQRLAAKFTLEHSSALYLAAFEKLKIRHRAALIEKMCGGLRAWNPRGV